MKYKIITDRFEVEKLAEDIFLSDDKGIVHMDYADLRTFRKFSTFKYAISFNSFCSNEKFIEELLNVIKSQDIPFADLRGCLINIRINDDESSLSPEDIGNLLEQVRTLKPADSSDDNFEVIWTLNTNSSIPLGNCYINIMLGLNKTAEDLLEDEKNEQMIEEYHKQKLASVKRDFSEFIMHSDTLVSIDKTK